MTKAFIEPIILKSESEALIIASLSKENRRKVKDFDNAKRKASRQARRTTSKRTAVSA